MFYTTMDSPLGELLLTSDGTNLTGLYPGGAPETSWSHREELQVFTLTQRWLRDYFSGEAGRLPLKPAGTPFQREVWQILAAIGWGQTRTYGEIAREMAIRTGKPTMSAQAVGQAVGSNPICIIVPCHRVVGAKGKLTGYAWGIDKKLWLLKHEGSR